MSETTTKLITWYFSNKAKIDELKGDQYVQELEARLKDLAKVGSHVWANPDVKQLWASFREAMGVGSEDKPLFTATTTQGAHGANPLNAKGDQR